MLTPYTTTYIQFVTYTYFREFIIVFIVFLHRWVMWLELVKLHNMLLLIAFCRCLVVVSLPQHNILLYGKIYIRPSYHTWVHTFTRKFLSLLENI